MCGICGVWGGRDAGAVEAMVGAMAHRGPDDRGVLADDHVTLGMARLAVIDTTSAGHQPMTNEAATVGIVYNGEAYNFRQERTDLESKGYSFRSSSDTEVVLRLYEHYGDEFLGRLRGMFALAIYDKRRGSGKPRLLLARDHFGIKPLLYTFAQGRLVFASEIKALLASGLASPDIDPEGLRLLLTHGSVYQPATILRGVKMLPPAHRLVVADGHKNLQRYWRLACPHEADFSRASAADLTAQVEQTLRESVRAQLVSDVPLGAFLSGGIDSSLLVAMMAREVSSRVRTFSVGYEAEGRDLDETDEAEETARFISTEHSRVCVGGAEVRELLPHIAWSLDQPSVDGANSYFVARAASRHVTVAISGNGGDELFAGYPWFALTLRDLARWESRPWYAAARSLVAAVLRWRVLDSMSALPMGGRLTWARALAGFRSRFGSMYQVFGPAGAAQLLMPELRGEARAGRSLAADLQGLDELPHGTPIQRVSALCLRGYNANQLLRDIDAVSMAHSLEVRVPFLDREVAAVALSLPDQVKIANTAASLPEWGYTYRESGAKRILFDVAKELLPPDFDLQRKRGFGMPFGHWLRGPLRATLLDTLTDKRTRERGILVPARVRAEVEDALAGRGSWTRPWLLLMLELWCRQVLDRCPPRRVIGAAP